MTHRLLTVAATLIIALAGLVTWHHISAQTPGSPTDQLQQCVPFGSNLQDFVLSEFGGPTLGQALLQRDAQCTDAGFYTPAGQRIQIFRLGGCWNMSEEEKRHLRETHVPHFQRIARDRNYEIIVQDCNPHLIP